MALDTVMSRKTKDQNLKYYETGLIFLIVSLVT